MRKEHSPYFLATEMMKNDAESCRSRTIKLHFVHLLVVLGHYFALPMQLLEVEPVLLPITMDYG